MKYLPLRETFQSPYEQYNYHIGKKFKFLGMVDPEETDYSEVGPMFVVELDSGEEIQVWPEEIFEGMEVTVIHAENSRKTKN